MKKAYDLMPLDDELPLLWANFGKLLKQNNNLSNPNQMTLF